MIECVSCPSSSRQRPISDKLAGGLDTCSATPPLVAMETSGKYCVVSRAEPSDTRQRTLRHGEAKGTPDLMRQLTLPYLRGGQVKVYWTGSLLKVRSVSNYRRLTNIEYFFPVGVKLGFECIDSSLRI